MVMSSQKDIFHSAGAHNTLMMANQNNLKAYH